MTETVEEQVEDEFYTLEEVDAIENTSFDFMARKFPNIRFKRKLPFKARPQNYSFSNGKTPVKPNKNKFKTGYVDRLLIRCYRCNDLGHIASECKKPKKKDKEFLELEAKYEALLRKQTPGKAYIAKGKCWDDTDSDEEEREFCNYALMANSKE